MFTSPYENNLFQLQLALSNREVSAVELTQYYLDQIKAYDGKLCAITNLNPSALDQAAALDHERAAGTVRSPLHGIPLLIKDNFDLQGMPTTASCAALKESYPAQDAFVIDRLRRAGALFLGKTNLSEFARHGLTVGSLIGQTHNPYDLTRTPGGSSGGTGAAIAANLAAAGLGSDTVNSIRSPSSANALVGFRPTTGLLSRTGIVPCSSTQDTGGPITRTVEDAAILLNICAGCDPKDAACAPLQNASPIDYTTFLKEDGLCGKRIGLLRTNFGGDPQVNQAMQRAISILQQQGAQLVELEIPALEAGLVFQMCDVQRYETKPLLDAYFSSIPNAPVKSLEALVASGKLHPSIYEDFHACASLSNPLEHPDYQKRLSEIAQRKAVAHRWMTEQRLDALCYPHQQLLVVKIGADNQAGRNGIVAAVLGWPAITVPGGFSAPDETAPIGVPIGVEFMGLPWQEGTLLEIAYSFQQAAPQRRPPVL